MTLAFRRGGGWGCEAQWDDREALQSAGAPEDAVAYRPSSAPPTWDPADAPLPAGLLHTVCLWLDRTVTVSVKYNKFCCGLLKLKG